MPHDNISQLGVDDILVFMGMQVHNIITYRVDPSHDVAAPRRF